jgi:chaperonin cofactor prefoldin
MESGEDLKIEFKRLESTVRGIKDKLSEVHGAIIGNPLSKDGGMAERLTSAEKQLEALEQRLEAAEKKQVNYNVYIKIMWSCIGGVAMAIFVYILQLMLKK